MGQSTKVTLVFLFLAIATISLGGANQIDARAASAETGVEIGNNFSVTPLLGDVNVECRNFDQAASAHFYCRANDYEPAIFSHFITAEPVDADNVTLNATYEDGTTRKKSDRYDPTTAMSKGKFNLFIYSLLQRPLLGFGTTTVKYILEKAGEVIQEGSFQTHLTEKPGIRCRWRTYYSSNMNDCRNDTSICREYFRDDFNCR